MQNYLQNSDEVQNYIFKVLSADDSSIHDNMVTKLQEPKPAAFIKCTLESVAKTIFLDRESKYKLLDHSR